MKLKIEEELYPGMALKDPYGAYFRLMSVVYDPSRWNNPICKLASIEDPKWVVDMDIRWVMEQFTKPSNAEAVLYF